MDLKREERYKAQEQRKEEQERIDKERVEQDERLRKEADAAEEARKAEVARLQREERERLQQEEDEVIHRQGEEDERERVRMEQQARIDRGDDWREVEQGREQQDEPPTPGDDDNDDDDETRPTHFEVITVDEVKDEDVEKERRKQEEKKRESMKTPTQRKKEAEEAAKREEIAHKQRSARNKVMDRYKARVRAKEAARQKKDEEQTAETRQRRKDAAAAGGYLDQPRADVQPSTSTEDTPKKRKRGVLDDVALAEGVAQLKKRKVVKASIKEKDQPDDAFEDPSYQPQQEEEEEDEDDDDDDLGEVPLCTVKEGVREGEKTHEHCSNPDEAEDHRIRIYAGVYALQEMVKAGDAVEEAYKDFLKVIVNSLLQIQLYLNIEKADVDTVYGLVPDQECEISRQVMVGGDEISEMRAELIKEQIMKPVVEREKKVKVTIDWSTLEEGMNEDETKNLEQSVVRCLKIYENHTDLQRGWLTN